MEKNVKLDFVEGTHYYGGLHRNKKEHKMKSKSRKDITLLLELLGEWWENQTIRIGFNLPRISARLEKLMGTNIVRLTDRKYMNELRQNIEEDYLRTLQKRIEYREEEEEERQTQMILKRTYTLENCPSGLRVALSFALVKEMERERNLIMTGKGEKIPPELDSHPVFIVNHRTNNIIAKRRQKLKTNRERNAERLLRQGVRWEKERHMVDKLERRKELYMQAHCDEQRQLEEQYREEDSSGGMELYRILNNDWDEIEVGLRQHLKIENDNYKRSLTTIGKQCINDPLDIINIASLKGKNKVEDNSKPKQIQRNANFRTKKHSLHPSPELNNIKTITEVEISFNNKYRQNLSEDSEEEVDIISTTDQNSVTTIESKRDQILHKNIEEEEMKGHLLKQQEYDYLHYENDKVIKLQNANNVRDLYLFAEDIIIGTQSAE